MKMLARHFTWGYFSRYSSFSLHRVIWLLFSRGGNFREEDKSAKNAKNYPYAKISTFTVCQIWTIYMLIIEDLIRNDFSSQ